GVLRGVELNAHAVVSGLRDSKGVRPVSETVLMVTEVLVALPMFLLIHHVGVRIMLLVSTIGLPLLALVASYVMSGSARYLAYCLRVWVGVLMLELYDHTKGLLTRGVLNVHRGTEG